MKSGNFSNLPEGYEGKYEILISKNKDQNPNEP